MTADDPGKITMLLHRVESGDQSAVEELVKAVEHRLRAIAEDQIKGCQGGVSASDVVQEATLKFVLRDFQRAPRIEGSQHFFALMTKMMSRIVIDLIRRGKAKKRPESQVRIPLDDIVEVVATGRGEAEASIEHLEHCLEKLRINTPRPYSAIYLHYFERMPVAEVAHQLGVSVSTVEKDLHYSRASLCRCMKQNI